MKSMLSAMLVAAVVSPLSCLADENPVKRECDKNHYILRFHPECAEPPMGWSQASNLWTYHGDGHTATLLLDGRVLVAGDTGVPALTAEIYNPSINTWSVTGPMTRDRSGHTATRLSDGRVLVVGGELASSQMDWFPFKGTAEIFDPVTGMWTVTGSLVTRRGGFTANLLPTGEVLVVGGYDVNDDSLQSAELFDPTSGTWRLAAPMSNTRFWHTATSLPDGNVLVVGGWFDDMWQLQVPDAEIYDWKSGSWMHGGTIDPRSRHSATLLDDGTVLIAGGYVKVAPAGGSGWYQFFTLNSALVFDPLTHQWHKTADLGGPRYGHLAAPLRSGGALIVQGTQSYDQIPNVHYRVLDDALTYVQPSGQWVNDGVPPLQLPATTVTRLIDGSLLYVGQNHATLFRF